MISRIASASASASTSTSTSISTAYRKTSTNSTIKKGCDETSFQFGIWLLFALQNWIFDFGRPIAMLFIDTPLNLPSIGDYFHMAYNIITPFCMLKLIEKAPRKVSQNVQFLSILFFVMGASIHLASDSVNTRLITVGYQNHIVVRENPVMQSLPDGFIDLFELLYFYDEHLGHMMWYAPFFLCLTLYLTGCFMPASASRDANTKIPCIATYILLPVSSLYWWYLITEGQIFYLFMVMFLAQIVIMIRGFLAGMVLDSNGKFMMTTFVLAVVLVAAWSAFLWNDSALRERYPSLIYIPEPWSYYTLHMKYEF